MKLATYKDGSRDGQLVVVSRDLRMAHYATGAAHTLQQALDDWNFIAPQLQDLYVALNQGRARHAFPFEPARCMAPLPRAFQWLMADAAPAAGSGALPLLRQGSGDAFAGPHDDMLLHDEAQGADCGAGLAVMIGDLPVRSSPEQALESIRLLLLSNDWYLSALDGAAVPAWQATAFGPVALTPDELGSAWARGRLAATMRLEFNGAVLESCDTAAAAWHFGQLLSLACRTRPLQAGTLLGIALGNRACEAAARLHGAPRSMSWGDRVRIEARGHDGNSLFGAIDQTVSPGD